MRRRPLIAASLALVATLASCSSGDDDASQDTTTTSAAPVSSGAAGAIPAALDFSAPLVGGGDLDLRSYAGQPLLLWFWAPT